MPYIMVEEVPEGMEAVDVIERSEYDSVVTERDQYQQQRDDALARIEKAEADARDAKAKYADYILGGTSHKSNEDTPKKVEHGALNARDLFKVKD